MTPDEMVKATPRTNAEAFWIKQGDDRKQYQGTEYVRAAICREIEREITDLQTALAEAHSSYEAEVQRYCAMTICCGQQSKKLEDCEVKLAEANARADEWKQACEAARKDLAFHRIKADQAKEAAIDRAEKAEAALADSQRDAEKVFFYEHDFYVLSNFSSFRLEWKGIEFDTSEHSYHWEKFNGSDSEVQDLIAMSRSAHEAFKLAESQKVFRRHDWDAIKVDVMREIIRAKANQHEYVRRKLLATGDRELVEDSWRDDFWGWGPNKDGCNQLGKLWMELRSELRAIDAAIAAGKVG